MLEEMTFASSNVLSLLSRYNFKILSTKLISWLVPTLSLIILEDN